MKIPALLSVSLLPAMASAGLTTAEIFDIGLYNTGVDDAGAIIALGSADTHWNVIETGASAFRVNNGSYAQPSGAGWIWKDPTPTQIEGAFTFKLDFDLTGYDPASTAVSGLWGTDNEGEIFLNGVSTGIALVGVTTDHFKDPLPTFSINSGFVSGLNSLEIVLKNSTSSVYREPGPGALLVKFTSVDSVAIPEPSVLLGALTVSALGLLLIRRQR